MATSTTTMSAPKAKKLNKKDQELVDNAKEGFQGAKNRSIQLSDEVLFGVIERAGTKWDEMNEAEIIAFLETAEATAKQVSISNPGISILISKMTPEILAELDADIEAVMRGKVSALHEFAQFKRIFTEEDMRTMPWPGTDKDDKRGNWAVDIVTRKAQNGTEVTTTWTHDFVSGLPRGKQLEDELADIKKETDSSGSSRAFKNWGKAALAAAKSNANTRRNALRSIIKRAITLHHQWESVAMMPLVNVEWIEADGLHSKAVEMPKEYGKKSPVTRITHAPKCLWIYPQGQPGQGKDFTVTQFLSWNAQEAMKKGGTMADLVATSGKGSDDPDAPAKGDGSNMTDDEFYDNFNRQVNYLNKTSNLANYRRLLADKKGEHRNDYLENLNTLFHIIKPIYEQNRAAIEEVTKSKATPSEAPPTEQTASN